MVHAQGAITQLMVRGTLDALASAGGAAAPVEAHGREVGSRAH
ncbi:MAG TPA: hypothetical protein VML58_09445 [Burkholderiaceae bacterium]|nr:hypothetical protein [Burkholderiaceae bacterium]